MNPPSSERYLQAIPRLRSGLLPEASFLRYKLLIPLILLGLALQSPAADDELIVKLASELKTKDLLEVHRTIKKIKAKPKLHVQAALMLVQKIRTNSDTESLYAADALMALGPGTTPSRVHAAMIGHPLPLVKAVGIIWLTEKKEIPDAAVGPLVTLWSDPRWVPRMGPVMQYLVKRKDSKLAVESLLPLLKHKDVLVRIRAIRMLGMLGKKGEAARRELRRVQAVKQPVLRAMASSALYQITGDLRVNQVVCLDSLKITDDGTKYYTLMALMGFGKENLKVFDQITKLFTHKSRVMRQQAATVVARIGKDAIPKVIKLLKAKDPLVRESAAFALGEMHQVAKPATKALAAAYQDDDARVRAEAISALGGLRTAAKEAEPTIRAALQDSDKETRQTAGTAIWLVAKRANLAAPILISFVDDKKNPRPQREYFLDMLIKVAPHSKLVVPAMMRWIDDKDFGVRAAACIALRKINKPTPKIIAALKAKLTDKKFDVQREAARAIVALEK